jgi:hypothetical protein
LSDRYDYDRAWQQLVFAQALEVCAIAHDEPIDAEAARDTVLAIAEVFAWLAERETATHAEGKGLVLLQGLKQAVERMEYHRPEGGRALPLFKDHCPDQPLGIDTGIELRNGVIPLAEMSVVSTVPQALANDKTTQKRF